MVRSYDKGNSPKNIGGIVAFELLQYRVLLGEKMKRMYQKIISGIILLGAACLIVGCSEKPVAQTVSEQMEMTQQEEKTIQSEEELPSAEEEQPEEKLRIALIDTGIAMKAVNAERILPGWNYCTGSDDTEDTIGHGTSLAGLIVGSDRAGLIGGAPEAYVVPLVCQTKNEDGTIEKIEPEGLAQLIRDAVDVYDCRIINISAGVKTDYDKLREAVEYATERGVMIVSCAGNEGNSDLYYPGGYESVLCVGSANQELTGRASFSQDNDSVDVLAPGEKLSVVTMKGNVMEVSGTSYSAAYVTAAAATLWQEQPESTSVQIVEQLKREKILRPGD